MAASDWVEIYRSYTSDELATEIANLKKQNTSFTSQSVGTKSYTKDLQLLQSKLQAAIRVRNERKSSDGHFVGLADFSNANV